MRDKRPVDELSIEELERILRIRKREARLARLRRYEGDGRRIRADYSDSEEDDEQPAVAVAAPQAEPVEVEEPPAPPVAYDGDVPQFEDELDRRRRPRREKPKNVRKTVWNRALLLVEIAATVGLVVLVVTLLQAVQEITKTSARIQEQYQATANARIVAPTATPVISVAAVVIPGGHTVSLDQGGAVTAAFNLDEVPAQYREQYKLLISEPIVPPTPNPEGPVRISIPSINVESTVVSGDSWQALQLGVGHHPGSANPGQSGNMVLSAHNDVFGEIFRHLDKMKPGDTVTVYTLSRSYTYVMKEQRIVKPTDVYVMDSRGDEKRLTLISCYPYQVDNRRIVIFATLVS